MRNFTLFTQTFIDNEISPNHWRFYGKNYSNSSDTFSYDESRIISMSFGDSCVTGDKFEIGTAIAPTMQVVLDNNDGGLDNFDASKEWEVHGCFKYNSDVEYDCIDTSFLINKVTYGNGNVTFDCIGVVSILDEIADVTAFNFGTDNIGQIVSKICTKIGHGFHTSITSSSVSATPLSVSYTYRDLLRWCSAIAGKSAYVDASNEIKFRFTSTSAHNIDSSYFKFSMEKNDISYSGARVYCFDGSIYGEVGSENMLCVRNLDMTAQTVSNLTTIANTVKGLADSISPYRPFSCTIVKHPELEVGDVINFTDINGNPQKSVITSISFSASGNMSIESVGKIDDLQNTGIVTKMNAMANNIVEIERTTDGLEITVANKVDESDYNGQTIAAKINASPDTVQIDAKNINLNGVVTANNNFKINTDGSMETISGKIGGWEIEEEGLEKMASNDTYDYTVSIGAPTDVESTDVAIGVVRKAKASQNVKQMFSLLYNGGVFASEIQTDRITVGNENPSANDGNAILSILGLDLQQFNSIGSLERFTKIELGGAEFRNYNADGTPKNSIVLQDGGIDITGGGTSSYITPDTISVNGTSPFTKKTITSADSMVVIDSGNYVQFGKMVTAMVRFHTTSNTTGNVNITASFPNPIFSIGVVGYNGNTGANDGVNYWFNGTLYTTSSLTANVPHNICFSYLTN